MKLLSHNTEAQLFEKIKSLGKQPHNSWRCLHLKLADDADYHHRQYIEAITHTIAQRLADSEGFIYQCRDGDIFIFFQGLLRTILNRLDGCLEDLTFDRLLKPAQDSLFTLYDLGKYWQNVYDLCQTKYLREKCRREETLALFSYMVRQSVAVHQE